MGSIKVPSGSNLPLRLQLFDGDGAKYPIAHVYNSAFVEISGSPFVLTHMANGLYKNDSGVVAPTDGSYTAAYIVYNDSGHTVLSTKHSRVSDEFDVDATVSSRESESSASTRYDAIIANEDESQITD